MSDLSPSPKTQTVKGSPLAPPAASLAPASLAPVGLAPLAVHEEPIPPITTAAAPVPEPVKPEPEKPKREYKEEELILAYNEPELAIKAIVLYEGDVVENVFHGRGHALFRGGNAYMGEWANGMMHGQGSYKWVDGMAYDGEFRDNTITGKGTYTWQNGRLVLALSQLECMWILNTYMSAYCDIFPDSFTLGLNDNQRQATQYTKCTDRVRNTATPHTHTIIQHPRSTYTGQLDHGIRHGVGTFKCSDSSGVYDGDWVVGKRHGKVRLDNIA